MYQPMLKRLETDGILSQTSSTVEWNRQDVSTRKYLLDMLPPKLSGDKGIDNLADTLASIVAPAARNQSFKGIFTESKINF